MTTTAQVGGVTVATGHLIGGAWVDSTQTFETRSPMDWDGDALAAISRGDNATATDAVTASLDGFETWGAFTPHQRAEVLHRLADLIEEHNDDIAIVESLDMGFLYESMKQLSLIHI